MKNSVKNKIIGLVTTFFATVALATTAGIEKEQKGALAATITKVSASQLLTNESYLITASYSGKEYLLKPEKFAAKGSTAIEITESQKSKSNTWKFVKTDTTWGFYTSDNYGLYFTNDNNGVACAENKGGGFEITATGTNETTCYVKGSDGTNNRYLAFYKTPNFRCYKNTSVTDGTAKIQFYSVTGGAEVESIEVKTAPTKVTYKAGECFDPSGLVITPTLDDKTKGDDVSYDVSPTEFSFDPSLSTPLTTSDTSIEITYADKITTQAITVNENHEVTIVGDGQILVDQTTELLAECTSGDNITWSIAPGSENVAQIVGTTTGESINVKGLAEGTADIVATCAGGDSEHFSLQVVAKENLFKVVTNINQLCAGDVIKLGCASKNAVALGINGKILDAASCTINDGYLLDSETSGMEFTLGGSEGQWTLTCTDGVLGVTKAKELAYDSGTTTWTISVASSGEATLSSTGEGFGTMKYNASSPRFTTYTSGQTAIEIYRKPKAKFTVTNNLTNLVSDGAATVEAGANYTANITAAEHYTLDGANVTVTMGGNEVQGAYSNGKVTVNNVSGNLIITGSTNSKEQISVTQNLTGVDSSFTGSTVDYDSTFETTLSLKTGYKFDDISVTATMGGVEVSNAYDQSTHKVTVQNVTGSVVLTVVANLKQFSISLPNSQDSHINFSNSATNINYGETYTNTLSAIGDYTLNDAEILVTMGGNEVQGAYSESTHIITVENVTGNIVVTGEANEKLTFNITTVLSGVSLTNEAVQIKEDSEYATEVVANEGYTLKNAEVLVEMGNVEQEDAYDESTHTITISKVTGNLYIEVTANESSYSVDLPDSETSHISFSNTATTVEAESNYTNVLTPAQGYTLDGVVITVTMDGDAVANAYDPSTSTITIESVSGDIVVIGSAKKLNASMALSVDEIDLDTLEETTDTATLTYTNATPKSSEITVVSGSDTVASLSLEQQNFETLTATAISEGTVTYKIAVTVDDAAGDEVVLELNLKINVSAMFTITNTLTNVSTDNDATNIAKNTQYSAKLTANQGYFVIFEDVVITMGGEELEDVFDIETGNILIPSVTGNIVITAAGTKIAPVSITVVNPQTSYQVGDEFVEPVVMATYNNGEIKEVTGSSFVGFDSTEPGNCLINVSYVEDGVTVTTSYIISVSAKPIVVTKISCQGVRTEYKQGDKFTIPTVIATYSDQTTKDVTALVTASEVDMNEVGNHIVTITYIEDDVTVITKIGITVIERGPEIDLTGCKGSVVATSTLLSILALAGCSIIVLKKRKEK